jgi:hypothetical protein
MQDIRGLRRDLRALDLAAAPPTSSSELPASTPTPLH